jgi:NitT/TauT family transport system substrate-binding protein
MMRKIHFALLAVLFTCPVYADQIPMIRLSGPPVAESIPLLILAEPANPWPQQFSATFTPWHSPSQLRAMIAGEQLDAAIITTAAACTLDNKGIKTRVALLFESPVWIISTRPGPDSLESLKGTLLFPFGPGEMPELLFKAALAESSARVSTRHAGGALEAVNLLLLGQGDHVLLSEPTASLALLRSQTLGRKNAPTLTRRVDMCRAWAEKFNNHRLANSCIAFFGPRADSGNVVVKRLQNAYLHACRWVLQNPQGALDVTRRRFPALAAQIEKAMMEDMEIRVLRQASSIDDALFYLEKMMALSPAAIGGSMPGRGFFEVPQ